MDRKQNTALGLAGVVGIWLTAGFALPLVNLFEDLSAAQLMVFRGYIVALFALALLRGHVVVGVDKYTYFLAATLPFATFGLFQGIKYWGAGPTIVVITATPLVNFAIGYATGRRVSRAAVLGLALLVAGVVMARWGGHFDLRGALWTAFGTVANGVLYEFLARTKSEKLKVCFWGSVGMGTFGVLASLHADWTSVSDFRVMSVVLLFVLVGGFLYWIANLVAFSNLQTIEASVLAQGETPAVIIGAVLILGERLTLVQWVGVAIALFGACYLSYRLAKEAKPTESSQTSG